MLDHFLQTIVAHMKSLKENSLFLRVISLCGVFVFAFICAEGQGCDCPKINTCGACNGGLISLTLKFNGSAASSVTASDQMGNVFSAIVNPGASFTFTGSLANQKFVGPNIEVRIGITLNATISSVCGTPVYIGDVFGSFTIVAGQSKNGGSLCCATVSMDNVKPVISNCPTNIIANLPSAACSTSVTWAVPTASDNCSVESFTSDHASGEIFPLGSTPVVYTAVDAYGNTSLCSFSVTVKDITKPVITGCPNNFTVSANSNCNSIATWTAPTATDNCTVSLTSTHNSGETFALGSTAVTYTATDGTGNVSTCIFNVIVVDNSSPIIEGCPSDIEATVDISSCNAVVSWTSPTASDNCSITFSSNHNPGEAFPIGTTEIKYTATDLKGNVTICTFNVIVSNPNEIVLTGCPDEITINANQNGEATVTWGEPEASQQCGTLTTKKSHEPGTVFSIGTTSVIYEFTDDTGSSATCMLKVNVLEPEALFAISKVVTPDGDGINDKWVLTNIENFVNNTVLVVDRWGNKIYAATQYDNENIVWNGTNKNGTKVPTGTYFYSIEIRLQDSVVRKNGYLEVIQ